MYWIVIKYALPGSLIDTKRSENFASRYLNYLPPIVLIFSGIAELLSNDPLKVIFAPFMFLIGSYLLDTGIHLENNNLYFKITKMLPEHISNIADFIVDGEKLVIRYPISPLELDFYKLVDVARKTYKREEGN